MRNDILATITTNELTTITGGARDANAPYRDQANALGIRKWGKFKDAVGGKAAAKDIIDLLSQ